MGRASSGEGDDAATGRLPLTPRVEKIVALAADEAQVSVADAVDTAHLLLALIDEGGGAALHALRELGAPPELVAAYVRKPRS